MDAPARPGILSGLLWAGVVGVGAWTTGGVWGALWVLAPLITGVCLLGAWRFGGKATALPVVVFGVSATSVPLDVLWVGWLPAVALAGVWMGMREETRPAPGDRAWMLAPLLVVAALLPLAPGYARAVDLLAGRVSEWEQQALQLQRPAGGADRRLWLELMLADVRSLRAVLLQATPSLLFLWMAVLVQAGRALSAASARMLGWPRLVAGSLAEWRLPDGALWLLLAGLGLLAARVPAWTPTAWTLTAVTLVGYCLQGVGVVQSLLLARGFPPYLAAVLIVFLVVMAAPAFLALAACVGVSDIWLDYRRLEHSPPGEES